jgi:hypothetical protein
MNMKTMNKMAAVAVSAVMVAACSAPGTTDLSGTGIADTTQGNTDVAGIVVMDAQAVNDLLAEFNALRTEVEVAASPALTDAWNVLEIQMANLVVSADTGGVPQDVIDEARFAVQDVTAAIQAEGDTVTESLTAAWNAFVNRFQTLTS